MSPRNLDWGHYCISFPSYFQNNRSEFSKTRHFKRNIHFFSGGRGLSQTPPLVGGIPSPRTSPVASYKAFWFRPPYPRIPLRFTPCELLKLPERYYLECMSDICCTRLVEIQDAKKPFRHHRTTLSGCIFTTKACIDNRKKTC